ncbi:MAG: membrane protein insertion efficiency factor YidD [Thermodesulfovibrio sp.]|nr:membrane protein insertion efficiency factor YidD [Thermodesulfovibrio sp.]
MEINTLVSKPIIQIIKFYRKYISPFMPAVCRFTPTCSEYAEEAVKKYKIKGLYLTVKRILKCHPFHPGGYDPLR